MIRLIVNADDFGLHTSVNKGILYGHHNGLITSTSLLASGNAFEEAVSLAKNETKLGIGIHTTLVGSLSPVLDPQQVKTLLDERGLFPETHVEFMKRVYTGKVDFQEVYRELDAQFAKIMSTGLPITHVDGHQHMHMLPPVLDIVIALMKKYKLNKIRIPEEEVTFLNGIYNPVRLVGKAGLTAVATSGRKKVKQLGIAAPRYFWGMVNGGHLDETALLHILKKVNQADGTHEIMTHPGDNNEELSKLYTWGYHWEEELAAMCSAEALNYVNKSPIILSNYKDVT